MKKLTVLFASVLLFVTQLPVFADDSAFEDHIETMQQNGVVSGYSDGNFQPDNDITRGQVSKIIRPY